VFVSCIVSGWFFCFRASFVVHIPFISHVFLLYLPNSVEMSENWITDWLCRRNSLTCHTPKTNLQLPDSWLPHYPWLIHRIHIRYFCQWVSPGLVHFPFPWLARDQFSRKADTRGRRGRSSLYLYVQCCERDQRKILYQLAQYFAELWIFVAEGLSVQPVV